MNKLTFEPSAEIQGKYEIVNTVYPVFYSVYGVFDFRYITEKEAAFLVEKGCLYIHPVGEPPAGTKKKSPKDG